MASQQMESQLGHADSSAAACGLAPSAEYAEQGAAATALLGALGRMNALELRPSGIGEAGGTADAAAAHSRLEARARELLSRLPSRVQLSAEDEARAMAAPLTAAFAAEVKHLNATLAAIGGSLHDLLQHLAAGAPSGLTPSKEQQELIASLTANATPTAWTERAHMDLPRAFQLATPRPLASWMGRIHAAHTQLSAFSNRLEVPLVTDMSALFSPIAFLTAVKQSLGRAAGGVLRSLDELTLTVEVTSATTADALSAPTARGVYVSGLSLSGARWDGAAAGGAGGLTDCGRELESPMPVTLLCCSTGVPNKEGAAEGGGTLYKCPVYHTSARGVSALDIDAWLASEAPPGKWLLAGVAIFLEKVAGL